MPTLDIAIVVSGQDAQESGGTTTIDSANLNCNATSQYIGLNFHHADMAKLIGATINSMKVRMNFPSGSYDDPDVIWKMYWSFYASTNWSAGTNVISDAYNAGTTATVAWNATFVGTGLEDSPELKTLFQELQAGGWGVANNAQYMVRVICKGNSASSNMRITAYDGTPGYAARLIIDYTPVSTPFVRRRVPNYLRM